MDHPANPKDAYADFTQWLRIAGRDPSVRATLQSAAARPLPVDWRTPLRTEQDGADHETLLDLSLTCGPAAVRHPKPAGATYAAFSAEERAAFRAWVRTAHEPAPLPFIQLLTAHLELALLEANDQRAVVKALEWLYENHHWQDATPLRQALLLHFWLAQDPNRLIAWSIACRSLPPAAWGPLLGWQALLGAPLQQAQLTRAARAWGIIDAERERARPSLRVETLTATLQSEPLAHALSALDEAERTPRPWRSALRGLRIALPQPDLRPTLEPLLRDLASVQDVAGAAPQLPAPDNPALQPRLTEEGWHIVLEFGHSRSEYFPMALALAQRIDTFTQLMDEKRSVVYRVMFHKHSLRNFWRLWNYVESWSSTRIYIRGEEIEKAKVWRTSQYLR